ncbi:protein KAKU4 [Silene latifolia]|uniref:protein KAKU4 n=1 Tax=Silene latifolia TaxID=37657 RepID=UPI003D784D32
MATVSSRPDTRTAGGKITRNRRPPPSSRTPYARPSMPPPPEEQEDIENPNWLSNLIYPAKVIASGAGKLLSFFGNDDSSSSEDDSENDDDEVDEAENDGSEKVFSPSCKSENKRKIEELVLEETFSREEGNQLIRLIKSRIIGTPPTRNKAVMEAKKWLLEKRSGSKKKLETELDSPSQFIRSEKGSPADMAKSYMQNRPAWASPSSKHVEFGSPSTLSMLHFKEETPTSTLRSSELKRSSFATGSWNLLDEIRRVRTKATEEFLAATPLTKTSLSIFSHASNQDKMESKGTVEAADPAESAHVEPDNVLRDAVANSFSRGSQDDNAVQSMEHPEHSEAVDVSVPDDNKDNGVNESRSTTAENGSVASDYAAGQNAAEEPKPLEEENGNPVGSSQGGQDVHIENSNILSEPIDIPCTTVVPNGSQNSSSLQEENLSQDFSHPTVDGPTGKAKETAKERKPRVQTRRARGRGK